jgi:hypothetical protein
VKTMRSEEEKGYLSFRDPSVSAKYLVMRVRVKGMHGPVCKRGGVKTTGDIDAPRTQGRSLRPIHWNEWRKILTRTTQYWESHQGGPG